MERSNPKSSAEWEEYHAKNREFSEKLKQMNRHYYDMDDTEFKNYLSDFTLDQLEQFRTKMKSEFEFYKKVTQEAYYTEHPEKKNTVRYEESFRIAKSINSKGAIIKSLILNLQSS